MYELLLYCHAFAYECVGARTACDVVRPTYPACVSIRENIIDVSI